MQALHECLSQIRVPYANQPIYKDECMYSYDTALSPNGIYVSLSTFLCFGADYVQKYAKKTNNRVFLHIRTTKMKKPTTTTTTESASAEQENEVAPRKITRLAIGLEGGYQEENNASKYEFQHIYSLVVAPDFQHEISYPQADLPLQVSECVEAVLRMDSAISQLEKQTVLGTWDGETRQISKYADELLQIDNGKKIPPSGWKCEKCELTNNLWLNLTDGAILCGRRFFDGTGGNNHAVEHYQQYQYPLAVKLGTISADGKSDVYSYPEDDMVIDTKLEQHLQHFGINMAAMRKSEKSMVELELEINRRIGEWSLLTESDTELKPLAGPGFTGMRNLGNSCYINSVMQVLFHIPDFKQLYAGLGAKSFFMEFPADPANDFNIQMSKLGDGLWSGKYSCVPENALDSELETGISPLMFKQVVGKNHADFSTKQQQDAYDFYLHVLNLCEKNARLHNNPADALTFMFEERVECQASKQVKYTQRTEYALPLEIPLEQAINKQDMEEYIARKEALEANGIKPTPAELEAVLPVVPLQACLERFFAPEVIEQFFSSAINGKTSAKKTTRLLNMPDYLMLHLRKFTFSQDWTPIKIDVRVQMPDEFDISSFRGKGLQAGEVELPDGGVEQSQQEQQQQQVQKFECDESILSELLQMGYPGEACKRAIYYTANSGLEAASNWLMDHIADADLSEPFVEPASSVEQAQQASSGTVVDAASLAMLMNMGFGERQARKALLATDANIERATDWILTHMDTDTDEEELPQTSSAPAAQGTERQLRDGEGKYRLVAFISHMGTSAQVGHYVCHIRKENGDWVIYNDSKVALSQKPPQDLGYLYLYERVE